MAKPQRRRGGRWGGEGGLPCRCPRARRDVCQKDAVPVYFPSLSTRYSEHLKCRSRAGALAPGADPRAAVGVGWSRSVGGRSAGNGDPGHRAASRVEGGRGGGILAAAERSPRGCIAGCGATARGRASPSTGAESESARPSPVTPHVAPPPCGRRLRGRAFPHPVRLGYLHPDGCLWYLIGGW